MLNKFNPRKTKYLRIVNILLKLFFHEVKADTKPNISNARSILVIDPTLIGDIVMLTPFLRIIRKNNEHCTITLACGKWAVDIIDSSFLNSIKNLAFNRKKLKELVSRVNVREYDYALEPRGDIRYIYFMHFCKAKRKISYNYSGGECFLTDVIIPSEYVVHLVEDKIYFLKALGCKYNPNIDIYPELEISDLTRAKEFLYEYNPFNKLVIGIHPGASLNMRQWEHYDQLLVNLNTQVKENVMFVIFKGPNEDEIIQKLENAAKSCKANYIISQTSLEDYMVRISTCNLMICNDSGAGHLSASLSVPVFVLFGPSFPELVRPYAKDNVFCFSEKVDCKPCLNRICTNKKKHKECLEKIKVEVITKTVIDFLRKHYYTKIPEIL